jgi:hypothetical protein
MPSETSYAANQAQRPGLGPYLVKLLFAEPVAIDAAGLHARLREALGDVDLVPAEDDVTLFAIKGHGGAQDMVMLSVLTAGIGDLGPALGQSWDWPIARDVASRARHAIVVTEIMNLGIERKARLHVFDHVLRVVLRATRPLAMHWLASERVVDPEAYLKTRGDVDRLAQGYVNVRFFRVEGRAPGECVMDTLGLASFGLPDLQCHYAGLDPRAVATVLFNYAGYVFDKGDVLEDGNTVEGSVPGSKWRCQHEMALVAPERMVIDFHPGSARPG